MDFLIGRDQNILMAMCCMAALGNNNPVAWAVIAV